MQNFIRSLFDAIVKSRTQTAEHKVAYQLWTTEYKHESFDYILDAVKTGRIYDLGVNK